jgi:hypothetical protein
MTNLIRMSDVQRREVEWLEPGAIPRAMLSLLAGHPGLGKSLWSILLAAKWSQRGHAVIICSAEDSLEHSIKPRLQAVQADVTRVHALVPVDAAGNPRGVSFPTDAALLLDAIRETGAVLAIIDPITAHLDATVDSHRDASLRSALAPLHRIAEETLAAVVAVWHLNKSNGTDPMMRLGGSIGGPGAARSALLLDRDPDDPDGDRGARRVLAHFKSNIGPLQPSRALRVDEVLLPAANSEPEVATARLVDLGESPHGASALLQAGEEEGAGNDAAEFLLAELGDGLDVDAKTMLKKAMDAGISVRTLKRAKKRLGVASERVGFGADGRWVWRLGATKEAASELRPPMAPNGTERAADAPKGANSAIEGQESRTAPMGLPMTSPTSTTEDTR